MAHFPRARRHPWFRAGLDYLDSFRTERGTYVFPSSFLQEKKQGYLVTGAYMGLEEGRRSVKVRELESTFWMLRIRSLAAKA